MNKFIIFLILVIAGGSLWYWYDNSGTFVIEEPKPSASEQPKMSPVSLDVTDGDYRLYASSSFMTWKGSRPLLDGYFDSGSVGFTDGLVAIEDGQVMSGAIVVDLTSISATETGRGSGMDRLSQHLMGEDFFDIAQYPTSSFRLIDLQWRDDGTYLVSGELTIKGTAKPLSFVASISGANGRITLSAQDVQVDRTLWDIRYGSGSFFDDLGDNLIDDIFTVSFSIVGVLQAERPAEAPELE